VTIDIKIMVHAV